MIRALVFDIDDTLIQRGEHLIKPSALKAITQAKKNGYLVIVATGRGYSFMHPDILERLNADYYVTINGTCVSDSKGNPIITHPLSAKNVQDLTEVCRQRDYSYGIKFPNTFRVYQHYDYFISRYCSKGIGPDKVVDSTKNQNYHLTDIPLDFFIYSPEREAMKLTEQFTDLLAYPCPNEGCDIGVNTIDKGKAIEELVTMLGFTVKECMAFGDRDNDIPMLHMCGIGVCMGNGTLEAKQAAGYVTTRIDDDGIYNALKHFEII